MRDLSTWELILRMVVAAGAGLVLGFERELRARTAGMRTHALVAAGAALFTIAGAYGFADIPRGPNVDPARIAAQVASGIGFLGAGAILRQGFGVRGLTTAATLWLAAAIGVTAGAGAYVAVAVGTGLVLIVLVAMRVARPLLRRLSWSTNLLEIQYERGHGTLGPVLRSISAANMKLDSLEVVDEDDSMRTGLRHALISITSADPEALQSVVVMLRERDEVKAVKISSESMI
jgi:putative Mg2+ transporter-C (MgtC) family protein